ncbi:unnamed protein product [Darwinula stevensoni]|uniref:Uncharacterized protein n=1 Tax=Darwinula stevensoni TaxID=69355 RepID=A0A7R9AF39_9CRUS|nr:unnamed protein product [Darwinula stevensoni]CAG0902924.1 unnamed protein product [Darwinula stevensoni]
MGLSRPHSSAPSITRRTDQCSPSASPDLATDGSKLSAMGADGCSRSLMSRQPFRACFRRDLASGKVGVFQVLLAVTCFVLVLVTGLLLGHYAWKSKSPSGPPLIDSQALIDEINATNIAAYLRNLTLTPHLAGREQELANAEWIRDSWATWGLDSVRVVPYRVLLSYPDPERLNKAIHFF